MTRFRLDPSIVSHMASSCERLLAGMLVAAILAGSAAWSSAHAQGAARPGQASGVPEAPIGHRQPNAQDVPPSVLRNENAMRAGDTALDKKLNICRGC